MKTNLAKMIDEKLWTISIVSRNTGISRTTLTKLCYGNAKGIQFETLDTLCRFFKVTPNDILIVKGEN